ncbi:MAG: DUF6265 family protein [Bacteroidota bacterium]
MRILILMLFVVTTGYAQDLAKVEWLNGTWNRTNAKPGRSGSEMWTKNNNELIGRGVTMKGVDTAFVEKLKIVAKDGKLFYVADVPENKTTVWFEFTSLTDKGFVCENPKHDFPKKISYSLDGDNLKAVISGDGKEIDYLFVRKK